MGTVLDHLRRIAASLAAGQDADIGCAALVETWASADVEAGSESGAAFETAVGVGNDDLAGFARDHLPEIDKQAWSYLDGVLQGDYDALQELIRQVPITAEVRLLRKTGANTVEKICIGRGRRNDVIILDEAVSTIHAQIDPLDDERARIVDCKSSNGTYVNNDRLEPHEPRELASGDSVRVGRHLMYYLGRDTLRLFLKLRLAEALRTYGPLDED